jgi:hypothetical protein
MPRPSRQAWFDHPTSMLFGYTYDCCILPCDVSDKSANVLLEMYVNYR